MKVLAGDLGGTKTLLMIARCEDRRCRPRLVRRYASGDFPGLAPMVRHFLRDAGDDAAGVTAACFGVAGPVTREAGRERARITNLPWELDSGELAAEWGFARVRLINDFQAVGYGIEALEEDDTSVLQAGRPEPCAPRAVIGAGTGLGMAILTWQGTHYEVWPSEGGHADFAPADDEEIALLEYLRGEFGRVSVERVLSGPGLVRIYGFLRDTGSGGESPELREAMHHGDPAAAISAFALEGRDALADRALDLFVRIYGAQAGNLALTALARGGLFVAGGIAPKIIDKLRGGAFVRAFNDKGRMAAVTAGIPVRVVLNPRVGLLGAALAAARAGTSDGA